MLRRRMLVGAAAAVATLGHARAAAAQGTGAVPAANAPAGADTVVVTLGDAQRLAIAQNLSFRAARQQTAVARGALRQARTYAFNPDLSLQVPGVAPNGGGRNPLELALLQEVEVAGQRGLRSRAAGIGVARAGASVANAARLTLADASTAFYRALAAERRLAVAQNALALNERLITAVRTQLREGEISTLEATLAEVEAGRARARVLTERRATTTAAFALKQQLGLAPAVPVRLVGEPAVSAPVIAVAEGAPALQPVPLDTAIAGEPDPARLNGDSLTRVALARRPDLAAGSAAVREAEALASLARREAIPNLRVGAFLERGPAANSGVVSTRVGPAVGIGLPFFNRGQGLRAQRAAEAQRARLERQSTELTVRTDVTSALRAYETATAEAELFATAVLAPARQNNALLETAFRAGKVGLPTLLLLRNQLLDAEIGYYDAWLARHEALVQLDAATGALLPDAFPAGGASPTTPPARTSR